MTQPPFATLPESIALVQDAIPTFGGAERVLETVTGMFPTAAIHTLVLNPGALRGTGLDGREIGTSFVDRLPGARRHHRLFLPLFPLAIESFDLSSYDIVLSFSYATAHGVLTRPDQLHLSYTYTPLRQAWHFHHPYLRSLNPPMRWAARPLLHYLRLWDRAAADRVDGFVAISRWVAACIRRAYRRRARVVYPPVNLDLFSPLARKEDHYVAVSRLEPHKRVDVVVDAFAGTAHRLLVIGDGSQRRRLEERATSNVEFLGRVTDAELAGVLGRARGLVHAAEEDFGIAIVEAQAAGCPVVAYSAGAARETVVNGRTGVLFHQQTPEAVRQAITLLERLPRLSDIDLRTSAERFSRERFQERFQRVVETEWERFRERGGRQVRPGSVAP